MMSLQGHKGVRRGPIRLLLALLALSVSAIALGFLLRGVDFYPTHQTGVLQQSHCFVLLMLYHTLLC